MPQSDFLIGLNAGSSLVGDVIGDKQRQAQLDLAKAQMEMDRSFKQSAVEQNASELAIRKKMLDEQSKHWRKSEEMMTSTIASETVRRDQLLLEGKQKAVGFGQAAEFSGEMDKLISRNPSGMEFFREAALLRQKHQGLGAHPNDDVRKVFSSVEARGQEYFKSANVSDTYKEVADLVGGSYLNPNSVSDPVALSLARQQRDKSQAETLAAQSGVSLTDALGSSIDKPELDPNTGGWSNAQKALVTNKVASLAKAKADLKAPAQGKIKFKIYAGNPDPVTGLPAVDKLTGKGIEAAEYETTIEELTRNPEARRMAEESMGRAKVENLIKGSQLLRVRVNGVDGEMTKTAYEENVLKGVKGITITGQK